jgi:hypothetical protein
VVGEDDVAVLQRHELDAGELEVLTLSEDNLSARAKVRIEIIRRGLRGNGHEAQQHQQQIDQRALHGILRIVVRDRVRTTCLPKLLEEVLHQVPGDLPSELRSVHARVTKVHAT